MKNINKVDKNAEYAIVTRADAHGKGYARTASEEILKIAFEVLGLERVYLYVSVENIAANKFYQKFGFKSEGKSDSTHGGAVWYQMRLTFDNQ